MRPRTNRTCALGLSATSWNQAVSVLAGTSITTVAPRLDASNAFLAQSAMQRPYGGLRNTTCFPQFWVRPFWRRLKNTLHFAFFAEAAASQVKVNSLLSLSKSGCGVG